MTIKKLLIYLFTAGLLYTAEAVAQKEIVSGVIKLQKEETDIFPVRRKTSHKSNEIISYS